MRKEPQNSMKDHMILYLVIPCYNEEAVLHETASQLQQKMQNLCASGAISPNSHVVFVDDVFVDDVIPLLQEAERKGIKSFHISSFL